MKPLSEVAPGHSNPDPSSVPVFFSLNYVYACQNSYKKYKKFMNFKLPNRPKLAQI